jgi:hypothetical protein
MPETERAEAGAPQECTCPSDLSPVMGNALVTCRAHSESETQSGLGQRSRVVTVVAVYGALLVVAALVLVVGTLRG